MVCQVEEEVILSVLLVQFCQGGLSGNDHLAVCIQEQGGVVRSTQLGVNVVTENIHWREERRGGEGVEGKEKL